ncbi:response regulator [Candidatus Chlorohelix sp.]|uniref:response regulator transcription factor n=1 Tax=Candidatus Chlorohelix sp. TaxID=3139201 RepID=UPI003047F493
MHKILIVEDDSIIQDLVNATLGGDNRYTLLQAYDGHTGLEIAKKESPILILLDLDLPRLNGLNICRTLKSHPDYAHIYILILSAMTQENDIKAGLDAGANDYFIKPFSPLALLHRVDDILDGKSN